MSDIFADLLGPSDDEEGQVDFDRDPALGGSGLNASLRRGGIPMVKAGVTSNWLADAFGIPSTTVRRKLQECPPKRILANGGRLYDLHEAATFLVQPRNMDAHLARMNPKDLPTHLQKEIWAARLAEQRWRQKAGELFASEDVIAVFSEVFKLIKNKSLLWIDSVNEVDKLSDEQEEALRENVRQLLSSIYEMVQKLATNQMTPSQIAEADDDERTDEGEDLDLEEQDPDE